MWGGRAVYAAVRVRSTNPTTYKEYEPVSSAHTPADDIVYDLVSIQYHALQGGETYGKYLEDAHEHEDVKTFIEQCQEEDSRRALRCHELLKVLTKDHGIG